MEAFAFLITHGLFSIIFTKPYRNKC